MPTTADYLQKLREQKTALAENLNSKGVTADSAELFNTLVPKVLDIDQKDQILVGTRYFEEDSNYFEITLPFVPRYVCGFCLDCTSYEIGTTGALLIFAYDSQSPIHKVFSMSKNASGVSSLVWNNGSGFLKTSGTYFKYDVSVWNHLLPKGSTYFWVAVSEDAELSDYPSAATAAVMSMLNTAVVTDITDTEGEVSAVADVTEII